MRLFVAVPVPEGLKERIVAAQDAIRRAGVDAKPVERENLHFTVKFLGETPEEKMQEIKGVIKKACADFKAFNIGAAGIGAFPSKDYARVVWISVREGLEDFENLIKAVDENISLLGFQKETAHTPHLTIARVRSGRNRLELARLLTRLEQTEIGKMRVNEVKLMKSTLSRKGPVYEEVYGVKLK